MAVKISETFDISQAEFIDDLCWIIYSRMGYADRKPLGYFFNSQHPSEIAVLRAAEEIFELLTGDSPDYDDNEEESEHD
jgi:hypothetical protein